MLGNVGTLLSFRIGAEDAPFIAAELGLSNRETLSETRNHRTWVKTLYNGASAGPYYLELRAPQSARLGRLAAVKAHGGSVRAGARVCRGSNQSIYAIRPIDNRNPSEGEPPDYEATRKDIE